ncbi:Mechanosensitive ion channel-domain-containing protein [Desarmillaria tabescens]|uniref:Mechanosensitive ion channel-domain-containing protein n=1 Tax=Armillaria tabescens TaxID=1929756 RepID=A0AA39N8Q6_ARMTA|nr:Mechanosensitive ion channel-domain-containing protein [Desarmillaria tabescens]KAK0461093.1 Mechanosensitive ion channel-domain-containing protein [Desarmillaria tabescens]
MNPLRSPARSGYDPVSLEHPDSHIRGDSNDVESAQNIPLSATSSSMYPPAPQQRRGASPSQSSLPLGAGAPKRVHIVDDSFDVNARSQSYDAESGGFSSPSMPEPVKPPAHSRGSSWDILNGIRKFEHSYEEFDSRNASQSHLVYADGDMPNNKVSKLYNYLLNVSIVSRWILFILPIMAILWIPGILQLTTFPNAMVWGVKLLWWSIWLSVVWGGWWVALAGSRLLPPIIRATVGAVAVAARRYIDWASALHRYVALFAWSLANWITWNPVIDSRQSSDASEKSVNIINLIGKLLFGIYLCAAVLLAEKFAIQWIAAKFHERSYAERIADQKFAVRSLVTLYRHSSDIPGRSDTLKESTSKGIAAPRKFFKRAMKGVRVAATTTTSAFGNVASEIAGSSVLQPNSPQAMVKTALESANKSRLLARRLFYSFVKPGSDWLFVEDIAQFFPTPDEADQVFALFDKDSNGDASRDEVEMACLDFHREQLSIEHSMQDLDSAVGRLDNILMSLYVVAAALIIAICLEAQLTTLITGAGTFVLGLSWLIGSSLSEVLTSIIFLFIRHPFDVGDRVDLEKASYTVKEIRLLSTIFLDSNGVYVQAPNSVLNTLFIQNIRRSPQMSETFTFDVSYATSFEDLERLREKMLAFVKGERRDYQPVFDVAVVDFPDQEKMTLSAEIKYKSNGQQGGLKAKRRNKWICALKSVLADLHIYGPTGNPDKEPATKRYTKVPWEKVEADNRKKATEMPLVPAEPVGGWHLSGSNLIVGGAEDDVFGEADELHMTSPRRGLSDDSGLPTASSAVRMPSAMTMPTSGSSSAVNIAGADFIEMKPRS